MTDSMIASLKKYAHKLFPDVKAEDEEILAILKNEIFKREIIEGDSADEAAKKIKKAEKAIANARSKKTVEE